MQKRLKKIGGFLASMRFGIALLVILALACALGSFLPQGNTLDWYLSRYPARTAALIYGLGLDDVFHSPWFLALATVLCCNLLLCNLLHLPGLIRRWQRAGDPEELPKADVELQDVAAPEQVFTGMHMPKPVETQRDGRRLLFSSKNRIGLWGAWVCHLGILLLIVGFTLGQVTRTEYTVYGVPGQTRPVGETGLALTIDAFDVARSDSGNAEQFTTSFTVRDPATGQINSDTASVNDPGSVFGYRVYQNSTGPAAKLTVSMDGKVQQEEVVCVGDSVSVLETPLLLTLEGYEEAYFDAGDGNTLPGYVYSTSYMGEQDQAGVQVEGDIAMTYGTVEIRFSEPQNYTLLQLKRDRYTLPVLLGGVITLLGLLLAFYLQPCRVWALEDKDGCWTVCGEGRKGGVLFTELLREAAGVGPSEEESE